ncbi:tetratricopeptide repeat protein [Flavobacteriales bacterium]|nr:tetratricopeptide repeat protein [Flavobacteriales bacterium]
MRLRVCIFFFLFSQFSFAQNCDVDEIKNLLDNKQYALVYSLADALQDCGNVDDSEIEWAQFQQGICALELFNEEAQFRLDQYLENYPHGQYRKEVFLALAKLHFRNKAYDKVIAKLNNVDVYKLDFHEEAMYFFRLGYSYFSLNKYEEAKVAFFDLREANFTYSELTTYCLSHMAYEEGNYATALLGFEDLMSTPKLGIISKYYITHIYYYQERYQKLVDFALPLLEKSYNPKRDSELKRLIGDAYFAMGNYESSTEYLESYMSEASSTLDRIEKYQLALAYYELKNYPTATVYFEDVLLEKDSLSQFAAHQLAQTYLMLNEKTLAVNAFKYASDIDYDYAIKEDAAFNAVKLIYEQQLSYDDAVESIEQFLENYPQSMHLSYVQDLLISAYTSTKDYKSAIEKLSSLSRMTLPQQEVFQKLSYYLAIEHFVNKRYQESIIWFDKSINYPINNTLYSLAFYWKAEAHYFMQDYTNAIESFNLFNLKDGAFLLKEYEQSQYALAYAYYQSKQYKPAILWFRKFVKLSDDNNKLTDAYLRLGDAYYMTKDYVRAQEFYASAEEIGTFDLDYAMHQQIQCFGLNNQKNKKRTALSQLIADFPQSPYNDDAMLNLSSMYLNEGRQKESVSLLTGLINKHPQSVLVKTALLKLGLNFYNQSQSDSAIYYFKNVIENYPGTSESKEALIAYKNVSVESGDVKSYFNYVGQLSNVSVDIAAKDSISYEASENLYLKQDYDKSAQAFDDYLSDFESPIFILNAHFYKAESLFKNNPEAAVEDYLSVLELPQNTFTERSLARLSRIEFDRKEFGIAAVHYTALLEIAQDNSLKRECVVNLFQCYKKLGLAENILSSAQAILELEKIDAELENEARLVLANSFYERSEFHLAKKEYMIISDATQSAIGSQAKYQLAYLAYIEGSLDSSESIIFELSEDYFSNYYIAKGFILLADIYRYRDNLFQSKATLQSIVDNYDGEDLVEICRQKIAEIDMLNEKAQDESEKDDLIINLLNDIELNELFEEENTLEDEE